MRNRTPLKSALLKSLLLGFLLPVATAQAQLPFDPSAIDQLTPQQRQAALQTLGASGSGAAAQAQPDGRFRDQPLSDPLNASGGNDNYPDRAGARYAAQSDEPYGADLCSELEADDRYGALGSDLVPGRAGAAGADPSLRDYAGAQAGAGLDPRALADPRLAADPRSAQALRGGRLQPGSRAYEDCRAQREARGDDAFGERRKRLKPFGYDLFRRAATTFAPATDIPIPSDYVIGPGDSIRVQLFGNENGNYSLQVSREGRINFPKLGPIYVAGQRFEDLKANLSERIAREMIGVQSSISLGELRSVRVFLTGDVNQPGSYTVSSLATITNALFVGGGVSLVGSLRNIQLKRDGRLVRTLDLYALLLNGDSSSDERLQPGDVIFVPPVGARVSADGEVKRPAIYELRGERSVAEIIALAGGLLASTNTGTAQIERFEANRKTVKQVDLARSADLGTRVQDGDLLRVGSIAKRLDNDVRVIGAVKYPGPIEWQDGLELKAALAAAQLLDSDSENETYLALGLIERTDPQSGVRGWLSFNVQSVLSDAQASLPLKRDDLVVILSRADVSYLDSRDVRAIAAGDFRPVSRCPALEGVARLVNTERSLRFLKSFTAESVRSGQSAKLFYDNASCPAIFRKTPRALQYLLEESVAVYGEVRRPGLYPVAPDTPLKMLVETAGGLSNESDLGNIEYVSYRSALSSGTSRYENLDLRKPGTDALKVSPGDIFNFKPIYLGQDVGTIRLSGEFKFPGSFGILRGERLSQVIRRAGGLTPGAYAYGAVFTRESARIAEQESYRRAAKDLQEAAVTAVTSGALGKDGQISAQFLSTVAQQLQDAKAVGRVVIEADPVMLEKHPEIDPIVENGDTLVMPKRPISVTVIGQVLNPGSVSFVPGASLKKYVERAGGYSQAADEGRVFVILPNGTAEKVRASFWSNRGQDIPPGSVIVVPRDAAPFNVLAFGERIFSLLSNLALTAAALATVSR